MSKNNKDQTKSGINISNRVLIILCAGITLVTLVICVWLPAIRNTAIEEENNAIHYIAYKQTTISELKALDGKKVCVTGFFSLASPYDNSWIYLSSTPLSAYPTFTSDTTLGEVITCFPKLGQKLKYTENCIAVTGTFVYDTITDSNEETYNYYMKDCEYKIVTSGSTAIDDYVLAINTGAVKYLDDLLANLNKALTSTDEYKAFDTELMKLDWKTYTDKGITGDLVYVGDKGIEMAEAVNTYKASGKDDTESEEYKSILTINNIMLDYMATWIRSCEVKGNEYHEA